jgi:predicted GNAT family acetyltransferase
MWTGMADVLDDREHHRFLLAQEGHEAELIYRVNGDRLVLVHTEVPEFFRGQGIGARLVQAAVDRASESGETIVPLCPYARKWLQDHADVASTVTIDWADGA